jgi:hypothetical protein
MNYNLSPTRILSFMLDNFSFIELLYRIRKEDDSITNDDLQKICTEKEFNREKLFEFGILLDQLEGNLIFNIHYKRFIEFLLKESNLSLPDRWANQTKTINDAFAKLQICTDKDTIIRIVRALRETISEFTTGLNDELRKLFKDTESIKTGEKTDNELTIRISKTREWIEVFVKPLNDIFDSRQDLTIIKSIRDVLNYSNYKKFEENDFEIRQLYEQLYYFSDNTNKELNIIIKHLSNELIPLLRRIESNSLILKGLGIFLQKPFGRTDLPILSRRKNHSIYSKEFADEANLFLDQFQRKETIYFENDLIAIDDWIPDSEHYKSELLKNLPIENFYKWCYNQLQTETEHINIIKFISLANLIHEKEFYAQFSDEQKFEIELSDVIMQLPKVQLYASIS